ncbi:MAG: hypothetical protein M5R41_19235 [Bacteroidia bacterium]|nr:hypothetical protein [Bacteroidia bacterium]
MKTHIVGGKTYRLPNALSDFQTKMFVHLIDWKRAYITDDPGYYERKGMKFAYDAILPEDYERDENMQHVYEPARAQLASHREVNDFRIHEHFYHMASSQAANINLFLPILHHPNASAILAGINGAPPDFVTLATDALDHGYCLEFWGGNFGKNKKDKGPLGDKSPRAGTDSDIAIGYLNTQGELCFWLIEHKLTELEFTTCGGSTSEGRSDKVRHDCKRGFTYLLGNKSSCYYHDMCGYAYWNITERNAAFFANPPGDDKCPFKGGMNQLWRNQLLGLAIENEGTDFRHAHFSVVRHPKNKALDQSLNAYKHLIADNPKFSNFTSESVIRSAEEHGDASLITWAQWYRDLYML